MYPKGLILKTAELYFYKKFPQHLIAKELGISVSSVSRILTQAVRDEIVRVIICDIDKNYQEITETLKQRYSLKEVVIIATPAPKEQQYLKKLLGKAGTDIFLKIIQSNSYIGIGAGGTVLEFIESLNPFARFPEVTLVPLLGGWGLGGVAYEANNLVVTMAELLHCQYRLLFCPAITGSKKARQLYLQEKAVNSTLEFWKHLDMVIFSTGPEPSIEKYPQLAAFEDLLIDASKDGAVGDILGHFINEKGTEVPGYLVDRLVSIPLELLRSVPTKICISGGNAKVHSLKTALQMGMVDVLVSDFETCLSLIP